METERERLERLRRYQELRAKMSAEPVEAPQDFPGSGVIEPAMAIGSSLVAEPTAGYAGMISQAAPGGMTGAERVEVVRDEYTYQPRTPSGQKGMERVGDLVEFGLDFTRMPVAMAAGLLSYISGGPQEANEAFGGVMEQGIGKTLGGAAEEVGAPPSVSAAAETAPEAVASALGVRGIRSRPASQAMDVALPSRRERRERMESELPTERQDARTVGYRMEPPRQLPAPDSTPQAPRYITQGGEYRRIQQDPLQNKVAKMGFDPAFITMIREATPGDRQRMLQMLDEREKSLFNMGEAVESRPTDVVGDAIVERVDTVVRTMKDAGRRVDAEARALKGRRVDVQTPVNAFIDNLDDIGIGLDENLRPIFRGSEFEGTSQAAKNAQSVISDVINRMINTKTPDAYDVHRLKKYIDNMVDFGKSQGGYIGGAENLLKGLRADLDNLLDANFDKYRTANEVYAETRTALDNFQEQAGGKRVRYDAPELASKLGQQARTLTSNRANRVDFRTTLNELDQVAAKYGAEYDGRFGDLVSFANEIDKPRNFGPVADTSIGGIMASNMTSQAGVTERVAASLMDRFRPDNEAKLNALRQLIRSFD